MAIKNEKWRVREVTKFHADDQHTTLESLEIWSGEYLVCEDVDTEEHARLIAAAPEMLEALKALRDACVGMVPECAGQVDIAISKATGETP